MKAIRHSKILELIKSMDVETQEELAAELKKTGMNVTQATVSRDIKELKLIKVMASSGKYKYAPISPTENYLSNKLVSIFAQTVLYTESVGNIVVIKTITGSANAACEAIDSLNFDGIVGTIAGDNTIFILVRTPESAKNLNEKIRKTLNV